MSSFSVYRGFMVETASGGGYLVRCPWTATVAIERGSGLVMRYRTVELAQVAIDRRLAWSGHLDVLTGHKSHVASLYA